MASNVSESRKELEAEITRSLDISPPQATMLVERFIDFFKDMRTELRKTDGSPITRKP
jgi:hypothetical protein